MFELVQTSERQPVPPGFATQCVVATALQKSLNEKNNSPAVIFVVRYDGTPFVRKIKITAHAVIFVVRPQGLEPWTH